MEEGDLYRQWKSCSKQLRNFQECNVIPIGSLSVGLCRHRAILFKVCYSLGSGKLDAPCCDQGTRISFFHFSICFI